MKRAVKFVLLTNIFALFTVNLNAFHVNAAQEIQLRFAWWGNDIRHKATLNAIKAYTRKNPNIKIIGEYGGFGTYYQKLITQLAGRTAADIIQIDYKWVDDLAAQGRYFVDMNKMTKIIDMSGFDQIFVRENCAVGNYTIGLPTGISALGLIGNATLLRQAGITLDQNWDWDKLIEAGIALQKFDKKKHLLYMKTIHYYYMLKIMLKQKTGKDFINPDYTLAFSEKDLTEVLGYFRKLIDLGVVPPLEETVLFDGGDPDQNPYWLKGDYGFNSNQASKLAAIIGASEFEIGVARYPIYPKAKNPGLAITPSQIISINSQSKHIYEAAKFIDWMFNDAEAIQILGDVRGLPAVNYGRNLLVKKNMLDQRIVDLVEMTISYSGGAENGPSLNQEIQTIVEDYILKVGFKRTSPENAAANLIKDLQSKLAELRS